MTPSVYICHVPFRSDISDCPILERYLFLKRKWDNLHVTAPVSLFQPSQTTAHAGHVSINHQSIPPLITRLRRPAVVLLCYTSIGLESISVHNHHEQVMWPLSHMLMHLIILPRSRNKKHLGMFGIENVCLIFTGFSHLPNATVWNALFVSFYPDEFNPKFTQQSISEG